MSRLTKRSIALLLAANLAACSGHDNPSASLEKAHQYFNTGKMRAAAIELKNLLKSDRNNGQARFLLGQINLRLGDAAGAEKELRLARQAGVPDQKVLPYLAEALLKEGKLDELLALDGNGLSAEGQARLMAAQGQAMLARGKKEDARKLINQALEIFPTSVQAQTAKARLLASDNQLDEAITLLKTTLTKHPDYADGWSLLGELEQTAGRHQAAVRAFSKAIELKVNNFRERFSRAVNLVMLKKLEEARKDLDAIRRVAPKNSAVAYIQGLIDLGEKKMDDAKVQFEQAILAKNVPAMAFYLLGAINLAQGHVEQAQSYAEQFLARVPGSIEGRKLAAQADLQLRQPEKAEMRLKAVIEANPNDTEAADLLATALIKMGRIDEATQLLEKVAKAIPDSAEAKARLGAGLVLQGHSDKAMAYFKEAVKLDPQNKRATVFMVLNMIRQGKLDEAVETAETYVKNNDHDPSAWNLLGHARLAAHQEKEAIQAFEKAAELAPGDPVALTTLARIAVRKKAYAKARSELEQILKHHPGHLGALMSLSMIDALEGKYDQMEAHLQRAVDLHPKAPAPRLALARYYLEKKLPDHALTQLAALDEKDRQTPSALLVQTRAYLMKKDYTSALNTAKSLVKSKPKSAQAWFLLAQAYAGLNKEEALAEAMRKAIELDPEYYDARAAYARLLIRKKAFDLARKEVEKLQILRPDHPETLQATAALAMAEGRQQEGLQLYEKLFRLHPTSTTVNLLAAASLAAGVPQKGIDHLEKWLADHPQDKQVLMFLANTYLATNHTQEAVKAFQRLLSLAPNSVVAMNNVAWYTRYEHPKKALALIEKAYALEPDNANVLDTYAMVLLANDQPQKALRMAERALDKAPLPPFKIHYANILVKLGEKAKAIALLEELLASNQKIPERDKVEALVEKLKKQ